MLHFDKGGKIRIAVVNKSKISFGDCSEIVSVLKKYNDLYLSPAWGTSAEIIELKEIPKGFWGLVFLDEANAPESLEYHDLTLDGLPLGKIFVKNVLDQKEKVSIAASHELAELLVDPGSNLCAVKNSNKTIYALEIVDPVDETDFNIDGIPVSNFVYPSWFESFRKPGSAKFDHLGLVDRPFKMLKSGYSSIIKSNGKWGYIFGSKRKAAQFSSQNHTGKRSVRRHSLSSHDENNSSFIWPFSIFLK
jgi:hypothetical protein